MKKKSGPIIFLFIMIMALAGFAGCMDDEVVGVGDGISFELDSITRTPGEYDVHITLGLTIENQMDMDLSIYHTQLVITTSEGDEYTSDLQIVNMINITQNDELPPGKTVRTSAGFRLDYGIHPVLSYLNQSHWTDIGYITVFSNFLPLSQDFLLGDMIEYSPSNRPSFTLDHFSRPVDVVMADLNHDGHDDLVVADFDGDSDDMDHFDISDQTRSSSVQGTTGAIHVFLMDVASGEPVPFWSGSYGRSPRCLKIAEVTGDNHPDIIVALWNSNDVRIIKGNGNGSFSHDEYEIIPVMKQPFDLEIADINMDGRKDIVVMGGHSSMGDDFGDSISILFSDVLNEYDPERSVNISGMDGGLEVYDLNGDGLLDIVAGTHLHMQRVNGTFSNIPDMIFDVPGFPVAGDIDGDGTDDLLLGDSIFLNDELENPDNVTDVLVPCDFPGYKMFIHSGISDLNGDGISDVIIGSKIFIQDDYGSFPPGSEMNLYVGQYDPRYWTHTEGSCTGDMNQDGSNDLAIIYKDNTNYYIRIFIQGG